MLLTTADGFATVTEKPTPQELEAFYNDLYFGEDSKNQYAKDYTDKEILHKYIDCREAGAVSGLSSGSLLDVGCGEGFFLKYFSERDWAVRGLDFTAQGVERHFPELIDRLETGNLFELLTREAEGGARYDLVVCNNVLEHVIDPLKLLEDLKGVVAPGGVVRLAVPNDGSWLQQLVVELGHARPDFWVCPPEHLSYFTVESLQALLERVGWHLREILTAFPIELYQVNDASNYARERSLGRAAHFARVDFEVALCEQSLEKLLAFRCGCAAAGIGRNMAAYMTLEA
ncbi:bifunctional 2-polyprenyl-6-hydroxyphenol methylase/3-demethylubiquinol 3-O-methyltransferase UbiG [Pelagibius sp.]|uniref:class I SAM-dependent methyltransferase n=1 Tax=Pelagibius sp. TaxID=1931238 RepID=UPI00260DC9CD|nr:class I SAM-dependent methyltransferase [Pelagibius sp.]